MHPHLITLETDRRDLLKKGICFPKFLQFQEVPWKMCFMITSLYNMTSTLTHDGLVFCSSRASEKRPLKRKRFVIAV